MLMVFCAHRCCDGVFQSAVRSLSCYTRDTAPNSQSYDEDDDDGMKEKKRITIVTLMLHSMADASVVTALTKTIPRAAMMTVLTMTMMMMVMLVVMIMVSMHVMTKKKMVMMMMITMRMPTMLIVSAAVALQQALAGRLAASRWLSRS